MFLFKKPETACPKAVSNVLPNMDGFVPLLNAVLFPGLDVP